MRRIECIGAVLLSLVLLYGCRGGVCVRPSGAGTDHPAPVFPDYREVTVPRNIAPLNFYYTSPEASRTSR